MDCSGSLVHSCLQYCHLARRKFSISIEVSTPTWSLLRSRGGCTTQARSPILLGRERGGTRKWKEEHSLEKQKPFAEFKDEVTNCFIAVCKNSRLCCSFVDVQYSQATPVQLFATLPKTCVDAPEVSACLVTIAFSVPRCDHSREIEFKAFATSQVSLSTSLCHPLLQQASHRPPQLGCSWLSPFITLVCFFRRRYYFQEVALKKRFLQACGSLTETMIDDKRCCNCGSDLSTKLAASETDKQVRQLSGETDRQVRQRCPQFKVRDKLFDNSEAGADRTAATSWRRICNIWPTR